MKRCPSCRRTYADDQNFCLDDGATLVNDPSGGYDAGEPPTINYPYRGNAAPTEMMRGAAPTSGGAPPYSTMPPPPSPPHGYMPAYGAQPAKRSPLPWIIGGVLVLALGIGAVVFLTSRGESSNSNRTGTGTTTNSSSTGTTTTTTGSTSSGSWQDVSGDGFEVSMPGKPQMTEQTVPSAAGPLPIKMYTLSQGYEGFITGYSEYPDIVFSSAEPEQLLDGAQQGAVSNVQGTVSSQRSISIAGHPGREIVGSSPGQNISFTARVYLAKPRMYMLVYTQYGKDKPISEDGKRFLDSFQITK